MENIHGLDTLFTFDLTAFASIIVIDLVMSGDNAIIIGIAASGLPPKTRRQAIVFGIGAATLMRVFFASITFQLLAILGLTLAGGILLLWVAYRMYREVRAGLSYSLDEQVDEAEVDPTAQRKTLRSALISIVVADVSMSLDNVLAVAGASHGYLGMLIFGLTLSIALMGFAATMVARLLERHHWIAYVGLVVITYVAIDMIWRGSREVMEAADMARLLM